MSKTNTPLEGMRVAILAVDGVENTELTEPRKALEQAGAKTTVFSPKKGNIQSLKRMEKAEPIEVDATLEQADPENFDAVLLPGGAMNADHLRVQPRAPEFVRSMDRQGKPIAVICHGAVAVDFGRPPAWTKPHQLSHNSGRYPQRWWKVAGCRGGARLELDK